MSKTEEKDTASGCILAIFLYGLGIGSIGMTVADWIFHFGIGIGYTGINVRWTTELGFSLIIVAIILSHFLTKE
jgi:hypothetical protein